MGLDLTGCHDEPCDRKCRLHSDLSIDFELPDRNSDPDGGERDGENKRQQGDDGQFASIPGLDKFHSMVSPDCHHPGSDIDSSGLRRIEQKSDLTGASTAKIVAVDEFAKDSSPAHSLSCLNDV